MTIFESTLFKSKATKSEIQFSFLNEKKKKMMGKHEEIFRYNLPVQNYWTTGVVP